MEPSVEIYQPSPAYGRLGWASLAGSAVCLICGLRAPLAFIPGGLCALTSGVLFWLACRPLIRVATTQFNIGERAVAWQEVREINTSRFLSPLILKLKLTNSRRRTLIFPGEPERIAKLLDSLRRRIFDRCPRIAARKLFFARPDGCAGVRLHIDVADPRYWFLPARVADCLALYPPLDCIGEGRSGGDEWKSG